MIDRAQAEQGARDAQPLPGEQIRYRADIDGLRAIAVGAVVLFHAGITGLAGGFVGVDVFFVISGFLIGGQIFREAQAGSFRYSTFYVRRVRRILPALFALLGTVYLVALLVLTPLEVRQLGRSAVATVFGASNILFYTGGGYFAPAADAEPLLMTWSLGVEEQFYIAFPVVMLLILRARALSPLVAVLVLSILSFAGSILLLHVDPKAAFYLLPTRAWELGIGAALALAGSRLRGRGDAVAAVALLALIGSVLLYRPAYAFPGWYVLWPTLATVVLIATPDSLVNRHLLGAAPMRFVGRVSYSWYLWHWPLFYLNRTLADPEARMGPWLLLPLSFVLAVASWRFVEQPLRRRVLPEAVALRRYAIAAVLVSGVGLAFYLLDGLPQRLPARARGFAAAAQGGRESPCLAPYGVAVPQNRAQCAPPLAAGVTGRLVVLGDSHASAIAPGFAQLAADAGLGFGETTKSSCLPLWGFAHAMPQRAGHRAQCIAFQDRAFAQALGDPAVRDVVLAGYWSNNGAGAVQDRAGVPVPMVQALARTIAHVEAAGKRVILVQDVPVFDFDPYARVIGDALPLRRAIGGGRAQSGTGVPRVDATRPLVATAAGERMLIDPARALCAAGACRYATPDALYYSDQQHVTPAGAAAALTGVRLRDREAPVGPPPSR